MMPVTDWYEPLIMPGIFTIFGVFIWWLAMLGEMKGKPAPWKWLGVVFFLLAMWFGFGYMVRMFDPVYYASLPSHIKRFTVPHYLAFFLPLLALIGCFVWQYASKKSSVPATAD